MSRLKVKVLEVAVEKGVDPKFIEANPYLTLSAQEFETISVLLRTRSLEEIINPFFTDSRYFEWQFITYLFEAFPDEARGYTLFADSAMDTALGLLKVTS
jgi:hypothetical protein